MPLAAMPPVLIKFSHSVGPTRPPVAEMTFCTMLACSLNLAELAVPPRTSITLSMSMNLRSFSPPASSP